MLPMTLITLPDGRRLDIEISGPDDSVPLIFHHARRARRRSCARCSGRRSRGGGGS
jgi:hypothetical protein